MTFDLYLQLSEGREEASSISFHSSILFADTKLKRKPVQLGERERERRGMGGRWEEGRRGSKDQVVTYNMFQVSTHCGQLLHIIIRGAQRCKTNFLKWKVLLKCPATRVAVRYPLLRGVYCTALYLSFSSLSLSLSILPPFPPFSFK